MQWKNLRLRLLIEFSQAGFLLMVMKRWQTCPFSGYCGQKQGIG
jgi:hypothetical protein